MCFLVAYRPPKIEFTDQSLPYRAVLSCNKDAYMPHGALHQLCTLTFSLISLNWFSSFLYETANSVEPTCS